MRKVLRGSLLVVVLVSTVLVATVAAWAAWQRLRDPLAAILVDPGQVRQVAERSYEATSEAGERRIFTELAFETEHAGTVRIATSRPPDAAGESLPLLVVLGGIRTGREALQFVPLHGQAILAAYEYPYRREAWYERARIPQIPAIRRAILRVPTQVDLVASRLAAGPEVDAGRTALLGFSFGALLAPAAQRVATARERPFSAVVLAYGGVDIDRLIEANLDLRPAFLRTATAWMTATALRPMEPALHLPELPGAFLVVNGAEDEQIPAASARRLAELTPEPKSVVHLATGHMGPRNPELTACLAALSEDWLWELGILRLEAGRERLTAVDACPVDPRLAAISPGAHRTRRGASP